MLEICVQMPVAQGRELMLQVTAFRESIHPGLGLAIRILLEDFLCQIDHILVDLSANPACVKLNLTDNLSQVPV